MSILIPCIAQADLHNCEGIWTNQPCSGARVATIVEITKTSTATNVPTNQNSNDRTIANSLTPANLGQCKNGEILIKTRPEPKMKWTSEVTPSRTGDQVRINGIVKGHGKISLDATAAGSLGDMPKRQRVWSQTINLPDDGSEKKFESNFKLQKGWTWLLRVDNSGNFKGYCTTRTEDAVMADRKAEEALDAANDAKNDVNSLRIELNQ